MNDAFLSLSEEPAAGSADPLMPDLASPHFHFHHDADSALQVLSRLGISAERITLRMDGRGWRDGWVVKQTPPPGTTLTPDATISLTVSGLGFFHQLPVGMWDEGGDGEIGTRDVIELFDDPFQKAAHWIREGARVFDIHPDNKISCSRWISIFGLNASEWPEDRWYELALLLPHLHRFAGREQGIRRALQKLLRLNLMGIRLKPHVLFLDPEDISLLGKRASQAGIDFIVGNRVDDVGSWELSFGPLTLQEYFDWHQDANRRRLESVLRLCLPCQQHYSVRFHVLDPKRAPRLGIAEENSCLGINSYLGAEVDPGFSSGDEPETFESVRMPLRPAGLFAGLERD